MTKTKITKRTWFAPVLITAIFIGLTVLASQMVIFSHPKPLHLYLEYLNKNSQRNRNISVYSKKDFAKKYLGLTDSSVYQESDFFKLFQEHFGNPKVKENNFFKVYKITDQANSCQIDIFGVSKKKDLVYASFNNICLKNNHEAK